jgi:hypothetical protein
VTAEGVVLSIPMPGHPLPAAGSAALAEVRDAVAKLEQLVNAHDVVFLLTDTRESVRTYFFCRIHFFCCFILLCAHLFFLVFFLSNSAGFRRCCAQRATTRTP